MAQLQSQLSMASSVGGDQWFCLELVGSNGLFLEVGESAENGGVPTAVNKTSGLPNQVWLFDPSVGTIQSRKNGLFLTVEVSDDSEDDDAALTVAAATGGDEQKFDINFCDEEDEDLDVVHIVSSIKKMMAAATAMPGTEAVATQAPADSSEEEAEAGAGGHVRRWRITRLADPGPPGDLSENALLDLGWS